MDSARILKSKVHESVELLKADENQNEAFFNKLDIYRNAEYSGFNFNVSRNKSKTYVSKEKRP